MVLCTVILSACSGSEIESDGGKKPTVPTVESVERNSCTSNVVNNYTTDNAEIRTRAVVVPQGNYEALISAKSTHQFIVDVFYKDDTKVDQDSDKPETPKLIEEKVGRSLEDIGTGEKFLNRRAMACAVRSRIDKWDLMKLQASVR